MAVPTRLAASRWGASLVGTACLAALVWLFGPLLTLFEDVAARLAVIAALLAMWAVLNLLLDARRRRRDRRLIDGITAANDEAAALSEKLAAALTQLRQGGRRGRLYEQPWYAIIGPPGAGKTTALLNAGLRFPGAASGGGPVPGVGGTRLCDWWLTEQAVLIDTAGRYTTQDSNAAADRAGWKAFLDLLKRNRPRQPLNGVLVAIALSDVATAPAEERLAHARAIRGRVRELEDRLGLRLPVYALFTKADLIAGFSEFFDDLDRAGRERVWGATFPLRGGAAFDAEFGLLLERLNDRLFARLQTEASPERRALIAGFPTQVATLQQPLAAFVAEAFGGSASDTAPLLRGAYFTSGTQEGTPIDRLTAVLARSFGVDQRRMPSLRPERGRSYFLAGLLRDVVFGEAMLVREPPGVARRRVVVRAAAFATMLVIGVVASGFVLAARQAGARDLAAASASLAAYAATAQSVPLDPVDDADLPRLAPLLDAARALPHAADPGEPGFGVALATLSQGAKLGAGSRAIYRHALTYALLPRLIWRLESQMRGSMARPDFLFEATRIYLMLGGLGPMDAGLVREWMLLDWQATYPGAFNAPMLGSLARHLDALLADPLPAVTLDGALVAQVRATFAQVPLAVRVYSRIKPSAAAQRVPDWVPAGALGPAGQRLFARASGKQLTEGIPGFLTVAGFHTVLLPALGTAAKEVASESWVLGQRAEMGGDPAALQALEQGVIALYEADYIAAWEAMLLDLNVVPLRSLTQAAQDLYILASPYSPMRDVLASAGRQLTLSTPPQDGSTSAAQLAAPRSAEPANVVDPRGRLVSVLRSSPGAAPVLAPGHEVDEHFKALRDLVAGGPAAPIEQELKAVADLQQQLAKLTALAQGATPPASVGSDPAAVLRVDALHEPQPLGRWLTAMASSSIVLRAGGPRQVVVAAFNGPGGPAAACPVAVNGRFPFTPAVSLETPMDDFGKLFAPGGLIDGFYNTELRPYVDASGKPWKPQAADGVAAPVSPADAAQFERAAAIRTLFFTAGTTTPNIRFDVTAAELDAHANRVTLDFDGAAVTKGNGVATHTTQLNWPGTAGMQSVRLVFDPPPTGGTGVLAEAGPWALFRMFSHGKFTPAGAPGLYNLAFSLGERSAMFQIRVGSGANPFAPNLLQDFHCPAVQ